MANYINNDDNDTDTDTDNDNDTGRDNKNKCYLTRMTSSIKKADTNKDPAKVKKARKRLKYLNTALKVIIKSFSIYII